MSNAGLIMLASGICILIVAGSFGLIPDKPAVEQLLPQYVMQNPCSDFTKNADGSWFISGTIHGANGAEVSDSNIPPGGFIVDGIDIYDVIQKKCGAR